MHRGMTQEERLKTYQEFKDFNKVNELTSNDCEQTYVRISSLLPFPYLSFKK